MRRHGLDRRELEAAARLLDELERPLLAGVAIHLPLGHGSHLREVEQLDTAETAAVLGVGDDVVKTRLHRARTALREQLLAMVGGTARDAFDFQAPRCDRVVHAVLARLASGR